MLRALPFTQRLNETSKVSKLDFLQDGKADGELHWGVETFVGRSEEIRLLTNCAREAQEGEPWLLVVEGEPGIGKTALIRRVAAELECDFSLWWAACDPTEQDLRFGVIQQWARHIRAQATEFPLLTGVTQGQTVGVSAVAAGELLSFLSEESERRPILLVVDDLQWADKASLRTLRLLVRRWWHERLVLLLSCRPSKGAAGASDGPERLVTQAKRGRVIKLGGLSLDDFGALTRQVGLAELEPWAVRRLHQHTDGSPLYAHSVLAEASAEELTDASHRLPVPHSLAGSVKCQLQRLKPDSRKLLDALAVLDKKVPLALAAAVADVANPSAALGPLLSARLVQWWPAQPTTPLCIGHALQRQAVYEAMSPQQRHALHAAAAPLVDVTASWAHKVAAASCPDPGLANELEKEATQQAAAGQSARAAAFLLWAAELSDARTFREKRLLTAITHALSANYTLPDKALRDAARDCSPCPARDYVLGRLAIARGDFAEAERLLSHALATSDPDLEPHTVSLSCAWLGSIHVWRDDGYKALPLLEKALKLGLPSSNSTDYARYMFALACYGAYGAEQALQELTAQVPWPPEDPERTALPDIALLRQRGIVWLCAGDYRRASMDLTVLTSRQRNGQVADVRANDYIFLAKAQWLQGDWDGAMINAEHAVTLEAIDGPLSRRAKGHAMAAVVAAGRGRWALAHQHHQISQDNAHKSALYIDTWWTLWADAWISHAQDDPAATARALLPLFHRHAGISRALLFSWMPLLAEAQIRLGDFDRAADTLNELRTHTANPLHQLVNSWLTGLMAQSHQDQDTAQTAFEQGLTLPDIVSPLYQTMLRHDYARMLLEKGRPKDAIPPLRTVHGFYTDLEAAPYAERAAAHLDACGATRHQRTSRAIHLTEREHTIARLAAQGLTNGEIAGKLYVSAKTVEYHLSNVYTKLSLTSRRQLPAALNESIR
ncbi:AAA family ATPase [Streptomyces sp. NPDC048384]|uniref:helix-turn-helix transcriptional regulator n=1 Tax=Streptomyces sp. NPDC048384 TaxID=3155487 RepID=UPI0034262307